MSCLARLASHLHRSVLDGTLGEHQCHTYFGANLLNLGTLDIRDAVDQILDIVE
jgi:hypothetical protein